MNQSVTNKPIALDAQYLTKMPLIDSEHKKLFDIIQNALSINSSITLCEDKEKLKKIIFKLIIYTKVHFLTEQNYMKSIKFPDYNNHILQHKNMLSELTNILQHINELNFLKIETILHNFIEEYFFNHIIVEDKKIALWKAPLESSNTLVVWQNSYLLNHDTIDKEHQELFKIAQEAFRYTKDHEKSKKLKNIISKLYEYMKTHFRNEEEYMKKIGYPKRKEHKIIHSNIIRTLNDFIKQLPTFKLKDFETELAKMINIILLQHIIIEDKKIIKWQEKNK